MRRSTLLQLTGWLIAFSLFTSGSQAIEQRDTQLRMTLALSQPSSSETDVSAANPPGQSQPALVASERNRFPEECAVATRTHNPPGFKYEILPPQLAAQYKHRSVGLNALVDQRYGRGFHLQQQGLFDHSYAVLSEVLCDWPDTFSKSVILPVLAINREGVGDIEAAVWFLERYAEALATRGQVPPLRRFSELLQLAMWYARLGDTRTAQQRISAAEVILADPQILQGNNKSLHDMSLELGHLKLAEAHAQIGDIEQARRALTQWEVRTASSSVPEQAHSSADRSGSPRRDHMAFAQLSLTLARAKEYGDAKRFAERALGLPSEAASADHELTRMFAFQSLAMASVAEGDGVSALKHLREYEKAEARRHHALRAGMERMRSRAHPEFKELTGAMDRAITESVNYTERTTTAYLFAQAYTLVERPQDAIMKLLESINIIENIRGFLSVQARLGFLSKYADPYSLLVETLIGMEERGESARPVGLESLGRSPGEIAFYYVEAARARLLSEQIVRSHVGVVEKRLPPETTQRERELLLRAESEVRRGIPFDESPAHRALRRFIEELRQTHPDYAALQYPVPVNTSQVALHEGERLLAYSLLQKRVAIWLLESGKQPRMFSVPVLQDRVLAAIKSLRASLVINKDGKLPAFDTEASRNLYTWLLAEPLKSIPHGSRLVVVPAGPLATIPFEALMATRPDGKGEFVDEHYTLSYAPSATVLTNQRQAQHSQDPTPLHQRFLAVGDPVYNEDDGRISEARRGTETAWQTTRKAILRDYLQARDGRLGRLAWTAWEVTQAASALRGRVKIADIRIGFDANEHDLKALALSEYSYLHFATHGALADDLPYLMQPALVLTQMGDLKGEDGFLTMGEILNMKLNAYLAVLSACQTGLGQEVVGEGIIGLMRAFLFAGSRSVLVSLWLVDDESTAALLTAFYQHTARGLSFSSAMQQARRDLRNDRGGRFAHPYHWAAFVLHGSE